MAFGLIDDVVDPTTASGDAFRQQVALRDGNDGIVAAVEQQQRPGDPVGAMERRQLDHPLCRTRIAGHADECVGVMRLESMRGRGEIGEVAHRIRSDRPSDELGMVGEHAQHGEPARRSTHHHGALSARPAFVVGVADQ